MDMFSLALTLVGLIIGLGAVTVIDLHGFLGRKSPYWTEATIRTHKVTKPLIWIGTLLYGAGIITMYGSTITQTPFHIIQLVTLITLIVNGCFLSFYVSPFLLKREAEGRARELLPASLQGAIAISFVISVLGWWGSVALLVIDLSS